MQKRYTEPIKALVYILFGLLILFFFNQTITSLYFLLSLYLIVDGLISIFQGFIEKEGIHDIFSGLLSIIVGLFFVINPEKSIGLTIFLVGAKFLIEGISYIYNSFKNRKHEESKVELIMIGKHILLILLSIWLIAQPISNITLFFQLLGIYALISGLINLIKTYDELKEAIHSIHPRKFIVDSKPYLISGLLYSLGFGVGTLIVILFLSLEQNYMDKLVDSGRTIAGILLVLLIAIAHAVIAGGLGGYLLSKFNEEIKNPERFIRRSILGFSIANIILIIPLIFSIFGIAFLGDSSFTVYQSVILFTLFGALYGLISSSIHIHKQLTRSESIQTIIYMGFGYAVGGALLGIALYNWFFHSTYNLDHSAGIIWMIVGIMVFGFLGGVSTNKSISNLRNPEGERKDLSGRNTSLNNFFKYFTSSEWMSSHTKKRFVALMILLLIAIGLTTSFILNKPNLKDSIPLQTVGKHWNEPTTAQGVDQREIKRIRDAEVSKHNYKVTCTDGEVTISGEIGSELTPGYYSTPNCLDEFAPQVAIDSDEKIHLFWVSDEVVDVNEQTRVQKVIYESIYLGDQFSEPAIIVAPDDLVDFTVRSNNDERLEIFWITDESSFTSTLYPYDCTDAEMTELFEKALAESQEFHKNQIVPSCGNRFDRILYTPNPSEEFSDEMPTDDAAYDYLKELASNAENEVLFANMWYDTAINQDSPGTYISQGVGELYKKVKENPENYPRGVSVKILLGNPPEFVLLDTKTQIWSVLEDLRNAGIEKMIDEDFGWRVEVANFPGALPHSHTKTMIIDGKTVVGAGFNVTYKHLPSEHKSGQGADNYDTALQVTGPIAQLSLSAFDNMWDGADQKHCDDFHPNPNDSWALTCEDRVGVVSHVPEVLKFYVPEETADSNALSLFRSYNYKESDVVLANSLGNAEETIDTIQVNFSLKMICDLNVLVRVCDYSDSLDFMKAIGDAVEENGVKVRVLTKKEPIESLENNIAIEEFLLEMKKREIDQLIEIRYFDGTFHNKAVQIDHELLFIGSQNFHYSAWGEGGLTEFNLATDNASANEEFSRYFEYQWERGIKLEDSI